LKAAGLGYRAAPHGDGLLVMGNTRRSRLTFALVVLFLGAAPAAGQNGTGRAGAVELRYISSTVDSATLFYFTLHHSSHCVYDLAFVNSV
jgi:hypothetical protein